MDRTLNPLTNNAYYALLVNGLSVLSMSVIWMGRAHPGLLGNLHGSYKRHIPYFSNNICNCLVEYTCQSIENTVRTDYFQDAVFVTGRSNNKTTDLCGSKT